MNKWVYRISLALVLAVIFYVIYPNSEPDRRPEMWNIHLENNVLNILGLTLNKSQLQHAAQTIKAAPTTALFTTKKGKNEPEPNMHIEAYFEDIYDEGDRVIMGLNAEPDLLRHIKKQAYHPQLLPNGVIRVGIHEDLTKEIQQLTIHSITLIAGWQVDFEEFQDTFGKPAQLLNDGQGKAHFLYPSLGLDFIQPAGGLQILQFVSPDLYEAELLQPLLKLQHENTL